MTGVVFFGLYRVLLAVQDHVARIEKGDSSRECHKAAFVSDLLPKQSNVQAVPPRRPVRVGDDFKRLVGEHAVSGIHKRPIGCSWPHMATGDILEWLDAVQDMPDIFEVGAAMIGAEMKASGSVGREAHLGNGSIRVVETLVLPGHQEDVVHVAITGRQPFVGHRGVNDSQHVHIAIGVST